MFVFQSLGEIYPLLRSTKAVSADVIDFQLLEESRKKAAQILVRGNGGFDETGGP
jgi:hypothetical protein